MAEPERAWSQKDVSHLVELIGTSERVEAEYLQSVGGASLKGRSQEDIREMVAAVLGGKEPKDLVVDEVDLPTPPEAGGGDADRVENEGREHRSSSETRENASLGGEDAAGAARGSDDGFFVLPAKRAREEREIGEENFRRPFGPPASARPFRLPPEVREDKHARTRRSPSLVKLKSPDARSLERWWRSRPGARMRTLPRALFLNNSKTDGDNEEETKRRSPLHPPARPLWFPSRPRRTAMLSNCCRPRALAGATAAAARPDPNRLTATLTATRTATTRTAAAGAAAAPAESTRAG